MKIIIRFLETFIFKLKIWRIYKFKYYLIDQINIKLLNLLIYKKNNFYFNCYKIIYKMEKNDLPWLFKMIAQVLILIIVFY